MIFQLFKYYKNNNFDYGTSAENYISPNNACVLGTEQKTELALIGDSHLDLISIEFEKELNSLGISHINLVMEVVYHL